MPFYEYECGKCGYTLEALQKLSDAPLKKCPNCGKAALRKLISSPVFRLKGSGWYETDFKSDKEGKRNLADAPERDEKKEDKKDDKKDDKKEDKKDVKKDEAKKEDTKPEAKAETKTEPAHKPALASSGGGKASKSAAKSARRSPRKPK